MHDSQTAPPIENPYSVSESALTVGDGPLASLDEDNQANITFTKQSIFLLIVLSIVTLGVYVPWWYLARKDELNLIQSNEKLSTTPFAIVLGLYALSAVTTIVSIAIDISPVVLQGLDSFDRLVNFVGGITLLIQSFKIKRMLEHYTGQPHSGVATFFLQYMYLQYKINHARPMEEDII